MDTTKSGLLIPGDGPPPPPSRLLTAADLSAGPGDGPGCPSWLPAVSREFRRSVLDPDYPCYFAVRGEKKGTLRYTAVDDLAVGVEPAVMAEFVTLSRGDPAAQHALVAFIRPEPVVRPHRFYVAMGWDLLQKLHNSDPTPWPQDVPVDPAHPRWEFCFGGEPMFVFGAMPSHQRRRSRNLGPLQEREVSLSDDSC